MTKNINPYGDRIIRVLSYLWENCDRKVTLIEISDIAAMSQAHFHRMYHAVMGETVFQTQKNFKMKQAYQLLRDDEVLIKNIAKKIGFSSAEAFIRSFQKHTGYTPNKWRCLAELPLSETEKERIMKEVTFIELPAFKAVSLEHKGSYMLIGKIFEFLYAWAVKHNKTGDIQRTLGAYYDDPSTVSEDDLRSEALLILNDMENLPLEGDIKVKEFAAQKFAVVEHMGLYESIGKTYEWFFGEWLMQEGMYHEIADYPPLEEYIGNPRDTKAEDLVTRIHIPIQQKKYENVSDVKYIKNIKLPTQKMVTKHHVGSYFLLHKAFSDLFIWAEKHNKTSQIKKVYGAYYDDPRKTPETQLRSDALIALKNMDDLILEEGMEIKEFKKQEFVMFEHTGPYEGLINSYAYIKEWMEKSEYDYADTPALEEYVNSPRETKVEDLITHILIPIKSL